MSDALHKVELDVTARTAHGFNEFRDKNGVNGEVRISLPNLDRAGRNDYTLAVRAYVGSGEVGVKADSIRRKPLVLGEAIDLNYAVVGAVARGLALFGLVPSADAVVISDGNTVHIETGIDKSERDNDPRESMREIHRGMTAHRRARNEHALWKIIMLCGIEIRALACPADSVPLTTIFTTSFERLRSLNVLAIAERDLKRSTDRDIKNAGF